MYVELFQYFFWVASATRESKEKTESGTGVTVNKAKRRLKKTVCGRWNEN
jgi:hypothetical protein